MHITEYADNAMQYYADNAMQYYAGNVMQYYTGNVMPYMLNITLNAVRGVHVTCHRMHITEYVLDDRYSTLPSGCHKMWTPLWRLFAIRY